MSRYDSLLASPGFSREKLALLANKRVLLIGVGGVGQHVSTYLITNGVKDLTIVDFDKVEMSNLNRQILLSEEDVGKYKVNVVKSALSNKNSETNITSINMKVDENNIFDIIDGYDVVIDAVDNWKSKLAISKSVRSKNILSLHIGVSGYRGQFAILKNKSLLDVVDESILSSPKEGVMGPMVGFLASIATLHLIRYLIGENIDSDVLYFYDDKTSNIGKINL